MNGWFAAVTYHAQKNRRAELAWILWDRTIAEWRRHRPTRWPTFEEWTIAITSTSALSQTGAEEARAVEGVTRVEPSRLRDAVSDLLESRACAIWVACVSGPGKGLSESVMSELGRRYPDLLTTSCPAPTWGLAFFFHLVRLGDANWRATARAEDWISALRHHVRHHPRYKRLIHYRERCRDLWSQSRPISFPPFAEWVAAADAYCVRPSD